MLSVVTISGRSTHKKLRLPKLDPTIWFFTHVFTKKRLDQKLAPPTRVGAPQRKIMDPPLTMNIKNLEY